MGRLQEIALSNNICFLEKGIKQGMHAYWTMYNIQEFIKDKIFKMYNPESPLLKYLVSRLDAWQGKYVLFPQIDFLAQ